MIELSKEWSIGKTPTPLKGDCQKRWTDGTSSHPPHKKGWGKDETQGRCKRKRERGKKSTSKSNGDHHESVVGVGVSVVVDDDEGRHSNVSRRLSTALLLLLLLGRRLGWFPRYKKRYRERGVRGIDDDEKRLTESQGAGN